MRKLSAGQLGTRGHAEDRTLQGPEGSGSQERLKVASVEGADWRLKFLVQPHLHRSSRGLWSFGGEKGFESNVHCRHASRLYGAHPPISVWNWAAVSLEGDESNIRFFSSVEENGHWFRIESKHKHKTPDRSPPCVTRAPYLTGRLRSV